AVRHHPCKGGNAPTGARSTSLRPRRTPSAATRPAARSGPGREVSTVMLRPRSRQHTVPTTATRTSRTALTRPTAARRGARVAAHLAPHVLIVALMLSVPTAAFADTSGPL